MDKNTLRKWLIPRWQTAVAVPTIDAGLYHYMKAHDGLYTRFHLRVEPDGRGLLLANASTAVHLSPTGVLMAKGLLEEQAQADIVAQVKAQFAGADDGTIQADLQRVSRLLAQMLQDPGNNPLLNTADAVLADGGRSFAPLEVTVPIGPLAEMGPLLDTLWQIGIPHVTFVLPEQFDQPTAVCQAIERAEDLGMIAGVHGRGTDLAQGSLLHDMAMAGVDHITVLLAAADAALHDQLLGAGDHQLASQLLADIQRQEVYAMAQLPLVESTLPHLEDTLTFLQQQGIETVSFFALVAASNEPQAALDGALLPQTVPHLEEWVEEMAEQLGLRGLWQPPVVREGQRPLRHQLSQGPRCAGGVAARVEANGDVVPPDGPYRVVGNIFRDAWPIIWQDEAFARYRLGHASV